MARTRARLSELTGVALGVLAEVLAPSRCAACDEPVLPRALFCPACATSVLRHDPPQEGFGAAFVYGGAVATAIARLKYRDRPDLAPRLARMLFPIGRALGPVDGVVPVPLHPRRLAERAYNQAALLAGPVAKDLGVPLLARAGALRRGKDTPKQAELDREARRANVRRAFTARPDRVEGLHVLVVDDVRTTGATLESCAVALFEAGARQVSALVLASVGDPDEVIRGRTTPGDRHGIASFRRTLL